MALDDDIRILSAVKLFQGFTQEQLRLLAFGAENTFLQADRKLYLEDDDADSAYIVVSGEIALYRELGGERVPIGMAGPGAVLSELALIADTRRVTSASAATDAEVIRLSRKMFRRILEEYPELAMQLHERILEEFQEMIARIEQLGPRFSE
ncbi:MULTISPECIES: cyclic nucleotide-binding domain-containing protein [unclassified Mesorhizobium]|uniref:cyclic nucleotide-binding domain-containing protein n=1 Tax=unclassified Mesorhizobium TaxID=325217 RepID=UPI000BAEADF0|nr:MULTISPECIES: cyclic nucleotide-binding domain-containing protein [unclassified Mesorhizobium]TGT57138.1 cyclic nucleotide-binding domain-containing protein [Mesorhizobium sp. M00.F.Ca.ET.170.01.1.1]AZO10680.1 cyclic nucleotide-binding domain-containing protein [Mesorhizobium sp. M3A.F.Ca.ET.080.04.2.1]PBB88779.1 cyclic nucleotide-binding protein [Mesorhizobium sp. WSM3876]RWB66425.1 MAG: cyclic nucleotide-binding domain-containing protein [Mesorhizobium sp.]RWB92561.1 MAG: cyclic nucleotid